MAGALQAHFADLGDLDSLAEAVDLHRLDLGLRPMGHPDRAASLDNLANALEAHFVQSGELDSLAEAVEMYRQTLDLHPLEHPNRSSSLNNLAYALEIQFDELGDSSLLAEAIDLHRHALDLRPLGHPDRSSSLNNLAIALRTQFEHVGNPNSLAEAIELHRQTLCLRPLGHPGRSSALNNLAGSLRIQSENFGDLDVLVEAVDLHRQALDLRPLGHPSRSNTIADLANALTTQFEQLGDLDSLAMAIDQHRQALYLRPLGHPEHPDSLHNLGTALTRHFEHSGNIASLAEAIDLLFQALDLRPPRHPNRSGSLNCLATALSKRFEQLGGLDSLSKAIALYREALALHPMGHPSRPRSLDNLANTLSTQFEQLGQLDSLSEAIGLHRQALDLRVLGHPDRAISLSNLATTLLMRFVHVGEFDSLAEALELHRQGLDMSSLNHPERSKSLNNLALALMHQFEEYGELKSLTEAIELYRQALDLYPMGHPDRAEPMTNLGNALMKRFEQPGTSASLEVAIDLHRQALNLRSLDHPYRSSSLSNLATALTMNFKQLGKAESLAEAFDLHSQALDLRPLGHPNRFHLLFNIADCILQKGAQIFDFTKGVRHILEALKDGTASARNRLREVIHALSTLETAYPYMTECARPDYDDLVLQAYVLTIRLLPQAASLGRDYAGRLRELYGTEPVTRTAATRMIILNREEDAVEIFEEVRGVFWAQALRLRGTELDLLPSEDAQKLKKLFQILEGGGMRDETLTRAQQERQAEMRRKISEAAEALVADIRSRPGMERFLMPPTFGTLVHSLPKGFFVLLNVSDLGHHALVIDGSSRSVSSVSLKLPARITGAKRKPIHENSSIDPATTKMDVRDDDLSVASGEEQGLRAAKVKERPIRTFEDSLADLWIFIVKPIIDMLQLKKSYKRDRPRVWWCTTGNLTFLPIHAAGVYTGSDTKNECSSDYMVSSYTPSIMSLVRARSTSGTLPRNKVVGLAAHEGSPLRGPDVPTLHKVKSEVDRVKERFEAAGASLTVINDTSAHPTVPGVLASLQGSDVNILHLSCHGVQKRDPLASAFLLRDGDLTIQHLMKLDLKHALLTFLSACQTAKGSQYQPDQAMHLAASMLFCGFKSVVATMWSMSDADGPTVAKSVYETLFKEERFDIKDVPYALDDAVRLLREEKVNAERWAVFVHMGA